MSLDVWLVGKPKKVDCFCPECGHKHKRIKEEIYFEANITHNLHKMAEEAGIYKYLWEPEEIGITKAKQIIKPVEKGLAKMKANPEKFKKFDSPNGWGLYENFVPWIEKYLNACKNHPEADVKVSR